MFGRGEPMLIGLETSKTVAAFLELQFWVKGSVENTWYPVYASSKSELMALVGGACEGIATRDQWSKLCKCSLGTIVLCTDSSAAPGVCVTQGCESTHSPRGYEGLLYPGLGDGTWTTYLEDTR